MGSGLATKGKNLHWWWVYGWGSQWAGACFGWWYHISKGMFGLHHCEWCHQTWGTKWASNGFDRGVPCILQLLHYWFINPGQWLPARFQEFAASTQMGVCFSPIPNRLPWLGESHPWCHQSPSCTPSLETTFLCWRDGLGLSFDVKHGFNVPNTNWIELKAKQCQCMFFFLTCRARQCQSGETRVLCTWPILMLHHWWGGVWRGSLG